MSTSASDRNPRHLAQISTAITPPISPPYQISPPPEKRLPKTSPLTSSQFCSRKYPRAPIKPPISATNSISYAQSTGLPSSFSRRASDRGPAEEVQCEEDPEGLQLQPEDVDRFQHRAKVTGQPVVPA